jgi:undecaprenol kinase
MYSSQSQKTKFFSARQLGKSLSLAFHGLQNAWKKEQNFRIEIIALIFISALGFYLRINLLEWIWILISAFLVISAELLNTAIERLTDLVVERRKTSLAKQAKDIAAAAVLTLSFQALIAGSVVFVPKILIQLKFTF